MDIYEAPYIHFDDGHRPQAHTHTFSTHAHAVGQLPVITPIGQFSSMTEGPDIVWEGCMCVRVSGCLFTKHPQACTSSVM